MKHAGQLSYRRLAKEIVARCLLWSGIVGAIRLLLWRDRVLILVYHDPKPSVLDQHLSYLRRIAEPTALHDLSRRSNGRPRFVITIDDGHIGNAQLLDVFKKHSVRPTIFLCSCIVGTRRQFWWCHPQAAALGIERLKRLQNAERLVELGATGFCQDADADESTALSAQDIARMRSWVDFQSHGRFHPILTRCDPSECEVEIDQSRQEIEQLTGGNCFDFAYPNGNYGEREIAYLRSAGYRSARTLDIGWNDASTDPFRLKAVAVSDDSSRAWYAVEVALIPAFVRYLRSGSLNGRSPQF